MLGAVVKEVWAPRAGHRPEDVAVVAVMPCTAKKGEAARPEFTTRSGAGAAAAAGGGHGADSGSGGGGGAEGGGVDGGSGRGVPHVDFVLTTRELGRMMR